MLCVCFCQKWIVSQSKVARPKWPRHRASFVETDELMADPRPEVGGTVVFTQRAARPIPPLILAIFRSKFRFVWRVLSAACYLIEPIKTTLSIAEWLRRWPMNKPSHVRLPISEDGNSNGGDNDTMGVGDVKDVRLRLIKADTFVPNRTGRDGLEFAMSEIFN